MIDVVRFVVDSRDETYGKKLGFSNVICGKCVKIVEGNSDDKNRKAVSNGANDILMNPEMKCLGDKVHYRVSGLNQVLAKLAKKNDVAVGFGFSFVLNSKGKERARVIGKMKQNVRICRKTGVKMVVCSYANNIKEMRGAKDLIAFARVIGMNGGEAKKALSWSRSRRKASLFVD
tara:strand:+ start:865 stop:1389 length:525 start_codon:yes stop_codon:yes gene_type:complete